MTAVMLIVEVEAHEKGCWIKPTSLVGTLTIQEIIDNIRVNFIEKNVAIRNRQTEALLSMVYIKMPSMGVFQQHAQVMSTDVRLTSDVSQL